MKHFQQIHLDKQAKEGRHISVAEVAKETGISRDTVNRWMRHSVTQFHRETLDAFCKYYGVPEGSPIPFLVYEPESN
jgi:transcriptional regulator with XRE-family HTH domain